MATLMSQAGQQKPTGHWARVGQIVDAPSHLADEQTLEAPKSNKFSAQVSNGKQCPSSPLPTSQFGNFSRPLNEFKGFAPSRGKLRLDSPRVSATFRLAKCQLLLAASVILTSICAASCQIQNEFRPEVLGQSSLKKAQRQGRISDGSILKKKRVLSALTSSPSFGSPYLGSQKSQKRLGFGAAINVAVPSDISAQNKLIQELGEEKRRGVERDNNAIEGELNSRWNWSQQQTKLIHHAPSLRLASLINYDPRRRATTSGISHQQTANIETIAREEEEDDDDNDIDTYEATYEPYELVKRRNDCNEDRTEPCNPSDELHTPTSHSSDPDKFRHILVRQLSSLLTISQSSKLKVDQDESSEISRLKKALNRRSNSRFQRQTQAESEIPETGSEHQQQQPAATELASQTKSSQQLDGQDLGGLLNGNNNNNNNLENEQQNNGMVTCPPDYEDQSIMDVSNMGNLTPEQQQQMLAGANGLLNSNGSSDVDLFSGSRGQNGAPPIPSHCIASGSRMIEIITKIVTPILFSIIIVVGLLGNIIVMLVIVEDKKTERELTPTNLLILDLSLADLSFIIFCIPFTGWDYAVGHWVFGLSWCKFNQYLIIVTALSSIYTLVLMSIDRFLAIVYPIECMPYRTSKNMLYAIYIKWIIILIIAFPTIQMHGLVPSPLPDQFNCRFLSDQYSALKFQIIFFITSYLFPLILIFCLYMSLLIKLWFGTKPHGHRESSKMLESKKRVTWLVAFIVVVFAICWCPIQVMLILMRLKLHTITASYVAFQVFSHILGYMNSCVNPIVYAFASETFVNSFNRSSLGRLWYACLCMKVTEMDSRSKTTTTTTAAFRNNNNNNNYNMTSASTTQLNHLNVHHDTKSGAGHAANMKASRTGSGQDNSLGYTQTVLIGQYTDGAGDVNDSNPKRFVTSPLEPRDREELAPLMIHRASPSPVKAPHQMNQRGSSIIESQTNLGDEAQNGNKQQPPKQQLVVRVAQSGNLVSHHM